MLNLEDDIEQSAREEWAQHLGMWELKAPTQRAQLLRIIQSASEEAVQDVRRSFGDEDIEIVQLIDTFVKQFDPEDLLVVPPQVKA